MTDVLAATDALGLHTHYYRVDGAGTADSIRTLLKTLPLPSPTLDKEGVLECLCGQPSGQRTCFQAVRPVPAACELVDGDDGYRVRRSPQATGSGQTPEAALLGAVEKMLGDPRPKALALSGGLDSAVVLGLLRVLGHDVPVYTLASAMPGYCELHQTRETACALGVNDLRVVSVTESDFIDALPDAIAAAETPFYNLHPVSKLLLARALAADAIEVVITGDAADQVFGNRDGRDYLPIVGALFRAEAVELRTPFADQDVIAAAESVGRDPQKSALRELACQWVPEACFDRPKRPTYAPVMDLSRYAQSGSSTGLAEEIGLPAAPPTTDRDRTVWITLALLVHKIRGEE